MPLSRLIHNRVTRSVRPDVFSQRRDEFRSIIRRSREVVLLAAATGIATGLFVRGLDVAVHAVYDRLIEAPLWILLAAPVSGLLLAALSLRYIGGGISDRHQMSTCTRSMTPNIGLGFVHWWHGAWPCRLAWHRWLTRS